MPFWEWLSEQPDANTSELWQAAAASVLLCAVQEADLDEDRIYDLSLYRRNTASVVLGYVLCSSLTCYVSTCLESELCA
jgi:hypothetical protein